MSLKNFILLTGVKRTAFRNKRIQTERDVETLQSALETRPYKSLQNELAAALKRLNTEEAKEKMFQEYFENPNKMVEAYLDTLPNTKKTIDLSPINTHSQSSITEIPDLSRFKYLEKLILSGNELLTEIGGDKIPVSVKTLICWHTDFKSAEFLQRLVNLETLNLTKNYNLHDLPDLSNLKKLKKVSILHFGGTFQNYIPSLPLTLTYLECSFVQEYLIAANLTSYRKQLIHHKEEGCEFVDKAAWSYSPRVFLEAVARVNLLRPVISEIPEASAKLCMNPQRIARLIDTGVLSLDDEEWMDI